VHSTIAGDQNQSAVTALADGGYVVTWTSEELDGEHGSIALQRYDMAGSAVGGEVLVNSTTAGDQEDSAVAALADGGYVVTWESDGQDGDNEGTYLQRYDADGDQVGGEVRVNRTTVGDQQDSAVTALADGGYAVTWESSGQDGDGYGIYVQRYNAAGEAVGLVVTGTAGDERLNIGTHQLLTVDGAGGNDTLTGGASADILLGGTGTDSLIGNAGDDYLNGGIGADRLLGGLGNDTYVVDNVGDRITDTGGSETVESSVSYTLGLGLEDLILTGTGDLRGTGNANGNLLQGNNGDNVLDGQAGGDLILGGGGTDTLLGRAGNDILRGGDGNDDLYGGVGHDILAGGEGEDRYVFYTGLSATTNVDQILDFDVNNDLIILSRGIFTTLPLGTLQASAFRAGAGVTTAGDADDRIIYDTTTGDLYYDANGTAAGGPIKFATLVNTPGALTVSDFEIIAAPTQFSLSPLASLTGNVASRATSASVGLSAAGNDIYYRARGDGQNVIDDRSGTADRLQYGAGITSSDLILSRQANDLRDDLRVAIHGSTDMVTVKDWFTTPAQQIETIATGMGETVLSTQVDQLIQAMAGFTAQTGLTWEQALDQQPQQVQTILAASWQS
ncbi:MAG: calcium-binding protein, partial [Nitrospira sp.]|nr:calcium-binding protein [Nitrospira sp.]